VRGREHFLKIYVFRILGRYIYIGQCISGGRDGGKVWKVIALA
jgi:hypothetical protein